LARGDKKGMGFSINACIVRLYIIVFVVVFEARMYAIMKPNLYPNWLEMSSPQANIHWYLYRKVIRLCESVS